MIKKLISDIKEKHSFLCVGLDTDIKKIPKFLLEYDDPVFEFNKRIIDNTEKYCVAYKPNFAFYENNINSLIKTVDYIKKKNVLIIADSKRGDIYNTFKLYADNCFSNLGCNAMTVSPYMGTDVFEKISNEYINNVFVILALTSNKGSKDFQLLKLGDKYLYEIILEKFGKISNSLNQIMFVIGATNNILNLKKIREIVPRNFLLIPGIGHQGGSLADVCDNLMTDDCGIIVSSSRSIIYASEKKDFDLKAKEAASKLQEEMSNVLLSRNII